MVMYQSTSQMKLPIAILKHSCIDLINQKTNL